MALTALIAAYHESAEPGALRATLPLAGRTLIERQARLALAAGSASIIVLVERMPGDLSAAIDRLRRDRIPVQVVRSADEAAQAVDAHDRLLLIADGAIVDPALIGRLARDSRPAVLTVPDSGFGEPYERIDAGARWAGLAAFDASLLRDTAAMLRDWDLQSTLLRRTLQAGADHVVADAPVAIIDSQADLPGLERQILARAVEARGAWSERLLAPAERAATLALMGSPVGAPTIGAAAAGLTGLGAIAFAYEWLWTGLGLILLATPLDGIAERLARLRMSGDTGRSWWAPLLPILSGAALLALAYSLAGTRGWGMILLAVTILAFLTALGIESEGRSIKAAPALAERKGMAWLMLPFASFGAWHAGLAALFVYAAGSFFWAQQQVHRSATSAPTPDADPDAA